MKLKLLFSFVLMLISAILIAPAAFILRTGQRVGLAIEAQDKEGNPATLTSPAWSVSPQGLVSLDVAADGLSATATDIPGAGVGTATVSASATDDIGEPLSATLDIDLVAADAAVFNIVAGTPEPRPDDEPVEPPPEPAEPPV